MSDSGEQNKGDYIEYSTGTIHELFELLQKYDTPNVKIIASFPLSKEILAELQSGHILVCNMGSGDTLWIFAETSVRETVEKILTRRELTAKS